MEEYERLSGQLINPSKSCFYTAPNFPVNKVQRIASTLGFAAGCLPINYLGCPLYYGTKARQLFDPLVLKLQNKVSTWLGNFLNTAGRITLIKYVLQSITAYQLAFLSPPKSVVRQLERFFANFFWGQVDGKNNSHWISWSTCCRPTSEGGLGIRALSESIQAHSLKLWWRFRTQHSLWSSFLKARYCSSLHPLQVSSRGSHVWQRLIHARDIAEPYIFWILGRGDCSIWYDKWVLGPSFTRPPDCNLLHVRELFDGPSHLSIAARNILPSRTLLTFCSSLFLLRVRMIDLAAWGTRVVSFPSLRLGKLYTLRTSL